jgi:hypothetical protein
LINVQGFPLYPPASFSLINVLQNLIETFDLQSVLDAIEPLYIIYKAEDFFLAENEKVDLYVRCFHVLLKFYLPIMNKLFALERDIPISSQNGKISIIKLLNASQRVPKLLVKEQLHKLADPISYEYYVGLTLNYLRKLNIRTFAMVFGRYIYENKSHVIYEYIRDKSDSVQSFYGYIQNEMKIIQSLNDETERRTRKEKLEVNILNILMTILISLQYAQEQFRFTHYDLHLNNILLVELNASYNFGFMYQGKIYHLVLKHIPYIIDFGRSHIDPEKAVTYDTGFDDLETNKSFSTFAEYQTYIVESRPFINPVSENDINTILMEKLGQGLPASFLEQVKQSIFFYPGTRLVSSIRPNQFHSSHDFYKLVRSLCTGLTNAGMSLPVWSILNEELEQAYPYHLDGYELPSNYPALNKKFSQPIDVVEFIDRMFGNFKVAEFVKSKELGWDQIAGGRKVSRRRKKNENKNVMGQMTTMADNKKGVKAKANMNVVGKISSPDKYYSQVYSVLEEAKSSQGSSKSSSSLLESTKKLLKEIEK